ncbi:hypothetical protein EG68_06409 [Paragonimus skrjabini miyazakii]|uniref:Uncharacterized protein n=1 Tax=Paragonimus skrjabini miyazakii TaxID=59628 RepID=A0A8S9YR39_9TREM|nr:hypothetical protein EG68_06409 [Paragonimus skrjabini miyazakii]
MSSLPRLDRHQNSFGQFVEATCQSSSLLDRINRLEARMSLWEKYRSPSALQSAQVNSKFQHNSRRPNDSSAACYSWNDPVLPNGAMLGLRHVMQSLTERFEEQLNRLELRVSRLECTYTSKTRTATTSGEELTSQLGNGHRILKATLTNLEAEVNTISKKVDDRCSRLMIEIDTSVCENFRIDIKNWFLY